VPKHAARCEFSDMMGRVTALYQECVLFDEWQQLCLAVRDSWFYIGADAEHSKLHLFRWTKHRFIENRVESWHV